MSAQAAGRVAANAVKASVNKAENPVSRGARRDPELYVLMAVMSGAFGLAGFYFGRKPTSATSETNVSLTPHGKPWETTSVSKTDADFKYQYYPGGNPANPPKDAPSALHSVIVPAVNLPKELHEKYNKWGKDGY